MTGGLRRCSSLCSSRWLGRERRDDGQISVLLLGYVVLLFAVVSLVAGITALHITRHRLQAVADAAALDAAQSLDRNRFYVPGSPPQATAKVPVTDASVRTEVAGYLALAAPGSGLRRLALVRATSPDGATAVVTVRAVATVPLLTSVLAPWAAGVPVTASAQARAE